MQESKGLSGFFRTRLWAMSACVAMVLLVFSSTAHAVPGDLDLSFGGGTGWVTTAIGSGEDIGYRLALQADGKIVVAGYSHNGSNKDFALVRYNSDGTPDTAFDTDGKVTTAIGSGDDTGYGVVIQLDGKIVVSGHAHNGSNMDFAVVRYNTDGSLDTSFGTGGKVTTPIGTGNDYGHDLALQSDGKIVVAGYSHNGSDNDFVVVRYNSDGSLDNTFDGDGMVNTVIGTDDYAYAVAIQPADGKIVVSGSSDTSNYALVRYNPDGSLDSTFDGDGKVRLSGGGVRAGLYAVAIRADGKIVAAGYRTSSWYYKSTYGYLMRYNSDGSLYMEFGCGINYGEAYAIALQSDGQEVVAGWVDGNDDSWFMVRVQPWTWNANISTSTMIGTAPEYGHKAAGYGVAIQSDGGILVGGYALNNGSYDFAVARYLGTGTATISGVPSGMTNSTSATLTVGGTDVAAYKYKLDSGSYSEERAVSATINLTSLGSGSHTVYVIGKSSSGYWQSEANATTATWTVDVDPPVVTGLSDDPTPRRAKTWNWYATDNVTTTFNGACFRYSIDQNSSVTSIAAQYWYDTSASKNSGDGTWYLHVQVIDGAGNESAIATVSVVLDNTPPTAVISGTPANPTNQTTATLTVGGTDATHYKYKVDGDADYGSEIAVSTPIGLSGLTDGSHTVYVIARDTLENWQTTATSVTWTVDTVAPVIAGLSSDATPTMTKSWSWSATDTSTPVTFRYLIDQSSSTNPSGSFDSTASAEKASGDGTWYLHVQGMDAAGNESAVTTVSVLMDNTPPTAALAGTPASPTNVTTAGLLVGGADVTHYKYKVDGGSYATTEIAVATPIGLSGLMDGSHTVEVIGRDSAGNWQLVSAAASVSWTVDTVQPVITGLTDDSTPTRTKSWTWSATDTSTPVTFRYLIDQSSSTSPTESYGSATSADKTSGDGTWYLHVQAKDAAGNESAVITVSATLDNTPPTATISGTPVNPTNLTTATLTVGGADATHYKYKVDSGSYGSEIAVSTPINLSGLTDGSHTVYVIARDTLENWQTTPTTVTWTVETVAPVITGLSSDATPTRTKSWSWSATDTSTPVTFRYLIDQSSSTSPSGSFDSTASAEKTSGDGTWYLHVQGMDAAGNESAVTTVSVLMDNTPPTATLAGTPASPTNVTTAGLLVGGADVTHYKYKVDGGSYATTEIAVATQIGLSGLMDGSHTVEVIGRDSAGNWQLVSAAASVSWTVDTVQPVITGLTDDSTPTRTKSWTWSATDTSTPVTFRYLIDQSSTTSPTESYGSATSADKTSGDGTWYLHVQAKDAAGNESAVITVSATLDNTPPTATISGTPTSPTTQTAATLAVGGEGVTHYKYKVDAGVYGGEIGASTPISLSGLTDGSHTVYVIARDTLENWQTTATSVTWTVETAAPVKGKPMPWMLLLLE